MLSKRCQVLASSLFQLLLLSLGKWSIEEGSKMWILDWNVVVSGRIQPWDCLSPFPLTSQSHSKHWPFHTQISTHRYFLSTNSWYWTCCWHLAMFTCSPGRAASLPARTAWDSRIALSQQLWESSLLSRETQLWLRNRTWSSITKTCG